MFFPFEGTLPFCFEVLGSVDVFVKCITIYESSCLENRHEVGDRIEGFAFSFARVRHRSSLTEDNQSAFGTCDCNTEPLQTTNERGKKLAPASANNLLIFMVVLDVFPTVIPGLISLRVYSQLVVSANHIEEDNLCLAALETVDSGDFNTLFRLF